MTIDTAELRRLAEAATPGPWRLHERSSMSVTDGDHVVAACGGHSTTLRDNHDELIATAAYIAAANPQTILALLDELDAMRELVRAADNMRLMGMNPHYLDKYDAARAKVKLP